MYDVDERQTPTSESSKKENDEHHQFKMTPKAIAIVAAAAIPRQLSRLFRLNIFIMRKHSESQGSTRECIYKLL